VARLVHILQFSFALEIPDFSLLFLGFFIYAYALFFYVYRAQMEGVLQGTMYFGYMLMLSYAFFLMLGAVGYLASGKFVRFIYQSIKSD
jgi:hypothetical protein